MAKQKKKRNKVYTGVDAAATRPTITRISAVNRSKIGQWWYDNKRIVRPIAITTIIVIVAGWLIYEIIRLVIG